MQTTESVNAALDVVNLGADDPPSVKITKLTYALNRVRTCGSAKSADIRILTPPFCELSNTQLEHTRSFLLRSKVRCSLRHYPTIPVSTIVRVGIANSSQFHREKVE